MKNKYTIIGIIITTLLLAGIAIFTALRLYQTREVAVAPNVPSSKPAAAGEVCGGIAGTTCSASESCIYADGSTRVPYPDATGVCTPSTGKTTDTNTCSLSFTITLPTATATGSATPTPTVTATATATSTATGTASPTGTPNSCNGTCGSNSNCQSNYICYIPSGSTSGNCRNTQCLTETDCTCAVATTTATVVPTEPSLPVVGTIWPTLLGTGFGVLVIIGSLLLAL